MSATRLETVDQTTFYSLRLVPRLWFLGLTSHNQIFLGKTLPQIIEAVFRERDISHYDLRLREDYPEMEYVCQYNESHLHFLSRWMESRGLFYFFEQGPDGEKVVVADDNLAFTPSRRAPLFYSRPSGLDQEDKDDTVRSLSSQRRVLPRTVKLKDYNYMRPSLDLEVEAPVARGGMGAHYVYGDHFKTLEEGQRLARVRAEELSCRGQVFTGESLFSGLCAGKTFTLRGHPARDMDMEFLVESVAHRGHQTGFQTSGLGAEATPGEHEPEYRNTLTALRTDTAFRPARVTERTVFHGLTHAVIDAAESGEYAELDEYGRYKVRLPFDLAGEPDGQASSWLRLAEPFAGPNYGLHFPLHKGVEVLVAFVGGDPDRPVIAAAAHNPEANTPIRDTNARLSGIKSAANNQLIMNDAKGQESVAMWSPFHNSGIAVGSVKNGGGGSIVTASSGGNDTWIKGDSNEAVLGECSQAVIGATNYLYAGSLTNVVGPMALNLNFGTAFTFTKGSAMSFGDSSTDFNTDIKQIGQKSVTIQGGLPDLVSAPITSARRALGLALTGVALSTAGVVATTECFSPDGAWSQDGTGTALGEALGTASLAVGLGLTAAAGLTGYSACQTFNNSINTPMTEPVGAIKVDGNGVDISVQPSAPNQATFTAKVSDRITSFNSKLSITKNEISLGDSLKTNTLTMTYPDGGITINSDKFGEISVNKSGVTIKQTGGGTVTVSKDGVSMTQTGGAKAQVTAVSAALTAPNQIDSITVANNGIKLNFLGGNLHAGPLSIDPDGMVQLG